MQAREQRPSRWAPWWVYVIAIVATNQLRMLWQPDDLATGLEVVIGVTAMALVAAVVTAAYGAVEAVAPDGAAARDRRPGGAGQHQPVGAAGHGRAAARGRRARPLVAVYVAAVLATYFAIGLALTLGLGLTPETVIRSDAAYLAQAALGAGMLAYAVLAPGRTRRRGAAPRRLPAATRPAAVFALGVAVTALELPTALPYLGAVGVMTRADLAVADWLPLLVTYNLIFVLPPLLLLAGHVVLGERAGALLERLRDRLGGTAREALLWVLGLVGFFLLADALGRFQVIG